jgi:hypothetical protein
VLEAHAYNPTDSGVKDQEDHISKPAWANSSARLYLEKPFTKIGGKAQGEGPEFKPSTIKNKRKKETTTYRSQN